MSYYCCECMKEISTWWVETYFADMDSKDVKCHSCKRAEEQLNQGGDEE